MVVVYKLTKAAHFILVKLTHKVDNIDDIYLKEISWLHGITKTIVSNRDPKFTSNFWKGLFMEPLQEKVEQLVMESVITP